MKRLIGAAIVCAAVLAGSPVPSAAADLRVVPDARHVERVTTTSYYRNWRDRCAWAGYYCLYAWDGYVYHYPWHDSPAGYARRHRRAG
jgi:hypothetical protein